MKRQPGFPTPYPELNRVLSALVSGVRSILGEKFVSACLQGSFAIGDFDAFSDVDFIFITTAGLDDMEVELLQEFHASLFQDRSPWARHLEGSYFPAEIIEDQFRKQEQLWYLDNGSNRLTRSVHCNTLVVRWTLYHHGIVLAGWQPRELLDPIPPSALREEIRTTMSEWGGEILRNPTVYYNRFYQGFIVLSYCRMLRDLVVGDIGSKQAGAKWFKIRYPGTWNDLIDRAWATRPCPEWQIRQTPDPGDFDLTLEFVRYCLDLALQIP